MQVEDFFFFWSYQFTMSLALLLLPALIGLFTSGLYKHRSNIARFWLHVTFINLAFVFFGFVGAAESDGIDAQRILSALISILVSFLFYVAVRLNIGTIVSIIVATIVSIFFLLLETR